MTNKQLVEIIKKVVKSEIQKEMKSYRKTLVKELGHVMAEQIVNQTTSQNAQNVQEHYETDDPILQKVLQGRNTQNFSKGLVEEGSRQELRPGAGDMRQRFQQIQEGVAQPTQQPMSDAVSFDEDPSFDPHQGSHIPSHLQNLPRKNYSDLVKRFSK